MNDFGDDSGDNIVQLDVAMRMQVVDIARDPGIQYQLWNLNLASEFWGFDLLDLVTPCRQRELTW